MPWRGPARGGVPWLKIGWKVPRLEELGWKLVGRARVGAGLVCLGVGYGD